MRCSFSIYYRGIHLGHGVDEVPTPRIFILTYPHCLEHTYLRTEGLRCPEQAHYLWKHVALQKRGSRRNVYRGVQVASSPNEKAHT